jgi:CBS domain-containing protein
MSAAANMASPEAGAASVAQLLQSWTLGAFLKEYKAKVKGNVLVLDANDTVQEALAKLTRRGVLAAPVLDTRRAVYWGWWGVADAVQGFMASNSDELLVLRHQIGPEPGAMPGDSLLRDPHAQTTGLFASRRITSFEPSSDGHMLHCAADPDFQRFTLLDLVQGAMLHDGGWPVCHRVAVCQPVGTVLSVMHVVTQSDVMRFLLTHAHALKAVMPTTVADLGLVYIGQGQPKGVLCVGGNEPALDAFAAMMSAGVSCLGVVRDQGDEDDNALVVNLSASDLRVVLPDRWGVLAQPVHRMLELACAGGARHMMRHGGDSAPPQERGVVAVSPRATLHDTLALLVHSRLHHVFVTEPHDRTPLAVISTSDILRAVLAREE